MTAPVQMLPRRTEEFSHLGSLILANIRRDRARLAVWFLSLVGATAAAAQAMATMYPNPHAEATIARAALMATPTGQIFGGPGYGLDHYTTGAIVTNELLMSTLLVIAIMSLLLVVRWSRGDEETGRGELVGASCTGRSAPLAAAIVVGFGLNAVIALGLTAGLMAQGLPLGGSAAYGLGAGLTGCFFVGVGAITAQVFTTARAATGAGVAVMGLFFLVRVAGDLGHAQQQAGEVAGSPLSWFSPFAWPLQTRAFVELRLWPLVFPLVLALALAALAAFLLHRRDFGAGLVQPKVGRAEAHPALDSPLALTLRLEWGAFTAWAAGSVILGLSCGFIDVNSTIKNLLSGNETLAKVWGMGESNPANAYFALLLLYGAVFGVAFAMSVVNRLHSSEVRGLAELQLSTTVSRQRILTTALLVAVVGGVAITVLNGLTLAIGGVIVNDASLLALIKAALALTPALLVIVGLGIALFGWVPRAMSLMWLYLVFCIVVRMFGGVFNMPSWAVKASVFGATPAAPADPITATPMIVMTLVGLTLMAVGYVGFRRRNISVG